MVQRSADTVPARCPASCWIDPGGSLPDRILGPVTTRRTLRARPFARPAALLAGAALAAALLAGCGSDDVSCSLDACTVTYQRGATASVEVLGVEAKLLTADANTVTLEVAGKQIQLTHGQPAVPVGGLQVSLDSVSDSAVQVRIGR